jgi:hypothetical protein
VTLYAPHFLGNSVPLVNAIGHLSAIEKDSCYQSKMISRSSRWISKSRLRSETVTLILSLTPNEFWQSTKCESAASVGFYPWHFSASFSLEWFFLFQKFGELYFVVGGKCKYCFWTAIMAVQISLL